MSVTVAAVTVVIHACGSSLACESSDMVHAAISLYASLGLGYDGLAALATSVIGLEIAPHFDKPFFSTSFTNMWGRRWNMSIGNTLRVLIYDPILEGEHDQALGSRGCRGACIFESRRC